MNCAKVRALGRADFIIGVRFLLQAEDFEKLPGVSPSRSPVVLISAGLVENHSDFDAIGSDLATGESNPEVPLQYQDLLEEIQQTVALCFYA
jgi:hypothetical protein